MAIQHAKIKSLKLKILTPKKHAKNPNKPIKNALKKEGKKSNSSKYPSKKPTPKPLYHKKRSCKGNSVFVRGYKKEKKENTR